MHKHQLGLAALFAFVALGCGDDDTGVDDAGGSDARSRDAGPPPSAAMIGPEGGRLMSADGQVQVLIPSGALDSPVRIEVALSDDEGPSFATSPVYELSPDGTTFDVPTILSITGSASLGNAAIARFEDGDWNPLPSLVDGDTTVAFLDHFSTYTQVDDESLPAPITPIDATIMPGMRTSVPAPGWEEWEVPIGQVTVSGTASPDGTGTWSGGQADGSTVTGTFDISGGTFSFSYDLCVSGPQLVLRGVASSMLVNFSLAPGTTCTPTGQDAGVDDASVGDGGDTRTPVLLSTTPIRGSELSPVDPIIIRWSKTMDPATLTFSGSLGMASGPGVWSETNFPNDTVTLSPQTTWPIGMGILGFGAADLLGQRIDPAPLPFTVVAAGGAIDMAWGMQGMATQHIGPGADFDDMAIDSMGRMIVVGKANSVGDALVFRLLADGSLDTSFGTDGIYTYDLAGNADAATAVAVDSSDNVYVVGYEKPFGASPFRGVVWKFLASGTLDNSFGTDGLRTLEGDSTTAHFDQARAVAIDSMDRPVIASWGGPSIVDVIVWRLNTDGTFDSTFNGTGRNRWAAMEIGGAVGEDFDRRFPLGVAVDSMDRVAVAVSLGPVITPVGAIVFRATDVGALDTSFGTTGWVRLPQGTEAINVTFDAMDRAVVVGAAGPLMATWRVTSAGLLDDTFGDDEMPEDGTPDGVVRWPDATATGRQDRGDHVVIDGMGRILVAGKSSTKGLWRLQTQGTFDTSFGGDGSVNAGAVAGLGLDNVGGIMVIGPYNQTTAVIVRRYLP